MANEQINPYRVPAGRQLDSLIHQEIFGNDGTSMIPNYSTEESAADEVKDRLKVLYKYRIITGTTRIPGKRWFARQESGPSTSTEVVAEAYPLAICRLALVLSQKR